MLQIEEEEEEEVEVAAEEMVVVKVRRRRISSTAPPRRIRASCAREGRGDAPCQRLRRLGEREVPWAARVPEPRGSTQPRTRAGADLEGAPHAVVRPWRAPISSPASLRIHPARAWAAVARARCREVERQRGVVS